MIRPLEMFETAPRDLSSHFLRATETNLRNGWTRGGFTLPSVFPPIDWSPGNRSFAYNLHAWNAIGELLIRYTVRGEPEYFEACLAHARSWLLTFQVALLGKDSDKELDALTKPNMPMEWYDMAVGLRAFRIAYMLDVMLEQGSNEDTELFRKSLLFHLKLLRREHFFREHSNHGFYQAFGQAAAARRFLKWPELREDFAIGMRRLRWLLRLHFSEEGPHLEHSPGYHFMVMGTLVNARRSGFFADGDNKRLMAAIQDAFQWMVKPNFCLAEFGDTDSRCVVQSGKIAALYTDKAAKFILTRGRQGKFPSIGVKGYPISGYAFARLRAPEASQRFEDLSYLAQQAGFHSRVHKHADHLAFVWYDRGRDILIDPARFAYTGKTSPGTELFKRGFWYADPKRVYVESTRAHNCVEIDGTSYERGKSCWGSALRYAGEHSNMAVTVCSATHKQTVQHRRTLVMRPGHFLLVLDWLNDRRTARQYRQWFQLAPAWQATLVNGVVKAVDQDQHLTGLNLLASNTALAPVRGQIEPLQGWTSDVPYSLVKTTSLAIDGGQSRNMGRFATLFVLDKAAALPATRFNTTLRCGQVVWEDGCGRHALRIEIHEPHSVKVSIATVGNNTTRTRIACPACAGAGYMLLQEAVATPPRCALDPSCPRTPVQSRA